MIDSFLYYLDNIKKLSSKNENLVFSQLSREFKKCYQKNKSSFKLKKLDIFHADSEYMY